MVCSSQKPPDKRNNKQAEKRRCIKTTNNNKHIMEILIDRKWKKDKYTISKVYVNGKDFGCNALEDKDRGLNQNMSIAEIAKLKVYGQTAIPTGRYLVTYTYSNHFRKYLPYINNTKGFTGVRIHSGNTAEDSLGCILIGKNDAVGRINNSRYWTNLLIAEMQKAWSKKEEVFIVIR